MHMRIAIDYSAAVNQRAGIGLPPGPTILPRRELRLRERWLTILWHRAKLPLPAEWLSGPVDLYHSPDFVLPPLRSARGILTVHDLAFLMRPECADAHLRTYLEEVVPRSVRRADYIIADSENTRNDLVVLLNVPPNAISVVPGGVEERFTPVTDPHALSEARRSLGVG